MFHCSWSPGIMEEIPASRPSMPRGRTLAPLAMIAEELETLDRWITSPEILASIARFCERNSCLRTLAVLELAGTVPADDLTHDRES